MRVDVSGPLLTNSLAAVVENHLGCFLEQLHETYVRTNAIISLVALLSLMLRLPQHSSPSFDSLVLRSFSSPTYLERMKTKTNSWFLVSLLGLLCT